MATYGEFSRDGLPSIHRQRNREIWKLDETGTDTLGSHQKSFCELQDQVRTQREELRRKEELIRELTCPYRSSVDPPLLLGPSAVCPSARGDLTGLHAKVESLGCKLRQKTLELDAASDTVSRLKEDNARLLALNADLGRQLDASEATRCTTEAMKSRSGHAVQALQEQYRSAQDRIRELEARVRASLEDGSGLERRHADFVNRAIYQLGVGSADDLDGLVGKIGELVKENVAMKGRIHGLTDRQAQMELDAKANRETIQRLLAEVNKSSSVGAQLHHQHFGGQGEAERLRVERDDLQKQVQLMEVRHSSTKKQLDAARSDLQERDARLARQDCQLRETAHSSQNSEKQMQTLLDSMASMLSSAYCHVAPTEEAVKEKVRLMCREVKEHAGSVAALEDRVRTLTRQFESQFETSRDRELKVRRSESEHLDLRDRVRALEGELAASDVIRDGLKADKEKFYKYMRRLAEALRMDRAAADVGFDLLGEGLLARAEQLGRRTTGGVGGGGGCGCCQVGGGGGSGCEARNLRAMREQLESKELHMELLRKKLAQLEGATAAATLTPTAVGLSIAERERAYKLQRHLEKSQEMLEEARQEIVRLRTQLMACSGLQTTAIEQDREIASLETTMEKLERVRQKQAKRIAALKADADSRDTDFGNRREQTDGLSHEVRGLRRALEEACRRERQLLEFRAAIARMLGLDAASLSIPDLDIIARLERLIQAQGGGAYAAFSAERPLTGMQATFQQGYGGSAAAAASPMRGRSPGRVCPACRVARCRCHVPGRHRRRSGSRDRARSVSPARDSRRY